MRDPLMLLLVVVAGALPFAASADIYRCTDADGAVRFVGDPGACEEPERQDLTREIQHFGEPEPPLLASPGGGAPSPTSSGSGAPASPAPAPSKQESLEALFLPADAAGGAGHWEVVNEAAVDPSADPDFVRWGVREKQVRHYTHRNDAGRVRVCSVELWGFDSEGQARLAEKSLSFPNWRFERSGQVLVMLHAVSRERGERATHGVFPECSRLGARIAARAESHSR